VLLSLEAYDHQPSCLSGQPSQVAAHLRCVGRAPVLVATTLEHLQMKQLYNDLRACWEAFRYTWHHRRYRRQQRDQIQLPF
jgi:hypothetical protein